MHNAVVLIVMAAPLCLCREVRGDADSLWPDLVLVSSTEHCVFENQGQRRVADGVGQQGLALEHCVVGSRAFADFDGDAVVDQITRQGIFLGNGDGLFGRQTTAFQPELDAAAFACGDLDGDGLADVLVCTVGIRAFFGKPDGTLESGEVVLPFEAAPGEAMARLEDLDGDGLDDVVGISARGPLVAFRTDDARAPAGGASRHPIFEPAARSFRHLATVVVADSDRGGAKDLVTAGPLVDTTGSPVGGAVYVLPVLHDRSFGTEQVLPVPGVSWPTPWRAALAVGDVNHDGIQDIMSPSEGQRIAVFLGSGGGEFHEGILVGLPWDHAVEPQVLSLGMHDLDLDGKTDLIVGTKSLETRVFWGGDRGFVALFDFASATPVPRGPFDRAEGVMGFHRRFVRGDADRSGDVSLSDALQVLLELFSGSQVLCGDASDVDDSGRVDVTDAVFLLRHLFQGGAPPPFPYPGLGGDLTKDATTGQGTGTDLGCSSGTFQWRGSPPCRPGSGAGNCRWPILQFIDPRTGETTAAAEARAR